MRIERGRALVSGLCLLAGAALAACGANGPGPAVDAAPDADAIASLDTSPADGTSPGDADAMTTDGAAADGGASDTGPTPVVGRRLLTGSVALIGTGDDSCTRQDPAPGDRWCAFATATAANGGPATAELWVINVSKSAAGADIKCDGTDSNCLRLTRTLFAGDLTRHGFAGETLIFYADNVALTDFTGTAFAWRPGWTGARRLTGAGGVGCVGHPTAAAAVCFENVLSVPDSTSVDLLAGALPAADGGPLPKVDTILYSVASEPTGVFKFGVQLSPAGDRIAWSNRTTPADKETLRAQRLNDDTSRQVVAQDVSHWVITSDSEKFYWLSSFNDLAGAESGTLQMATFPDGADPTTLMANVGEYAEIPSGGIIARSGIVAGGGELKIIPDRDNPGAVKILDSHVVAFWGWTTNGLAAVYSKTFDAAKQLHDLYFNTVTAQAPCPLVTGTLSAGPVTVSSLKADANITWAELDPATDQFQAYTAPVATCLSTRFASGVTRWLALEEGNIWQDDTITGNEGTIRYGRFTNGLLPNGGTIVDTLASVNYAVLRVPGVIVYTVNSNGTRDGLYISSGLPQWATARP